MASRPNNNAIAVVAVDPGVKGGIGWMIPTRSDTRVSGCEPLVGFAATRELVRELKGRCPAGVEMVGFVEMLQPVMGRKRGSFGSWKLSASMTEAACAFKVELGYQSTYMVKPEVWEKALGLYMRTKIEKREKCREWFPNRADDDLKALHGLCAEADKVAEALLIAHYGWMALGNMP